MAIGIVSSVILSIALLCVPSPLKHLRLLTRGFLFPTRFASLCTRCRLIPGHPVSHSPQYWEIYVHSEVVGISVPFMVVDMLGGVFSDLSLVFKPPPFNTIAAISYSLVVVSISYITLTSLRVCLS